MSSREIEPFENVEREPSFNYPAKKRRIVILLLAYSAIFGIVSCFLPDEDTPLDFLVGLPFLILGLSWCFTDASERNHQIGRLTRLLLILLFILGLPIYLLQTRGINAFKTLAFALLLVTAMFTCMFVTGNATLYAGDVAGFWEFAF